MFAYFPIPIQAIVSVIITIFLLCFSSTSSRVETDKKKSKVVIIGASILATFRLVVLCERDVSMDRGFKKELRELMRGKQRDLVVRPRVFVKGIYMGGAEEVMNIVEEGWMGKVLEGLPRKLSLETCEGCGDVRFLSCFSCNGSSKMLMVVKESDEQRQGRSTVVVRCLDCNENGVVFCPICS